MSFKYVFKFKLLILFAFFLIMKNFTLLCVLILSFKKKCFLGLSFLLFLSFIFKNFKVVWLLYIIFVIKSDLVKYFLFVLLMFKIIDM